MKIKPQHRTGDRIRLTDDALANYGDQYRDQAFTITHVATSRADHPGFDESAGCALYDCAGLQFSLYEWEIIGA